MSDAIKFKMSAVHIIIYTSFASHSSLCQRLLSYNVGNIHRYFLIMADVPKNGIDV